MIKHTRLAIPSSEMGAHATQCPCNLAGLVASGVSLTEFMLEGDDAQHQPCSIVHRTVLPAVEQRIKMLRLMQQCISGAVNPGWSIFDVWWTRLRRDQIS